VLFYFFFGVFFAVVFFAVAFVVVFFAVVFLVAVFFTGIICPSLTVLCLFLGFCQVALNSKKCYNG